MKCSANEVMTLAAKAAHGAGAPSAQAAAFGNAALCHLRAGRAEDALLRALSALPTGPILEIPLLIMRMVEQSMQGTARAKINAKGFVDLAQSYLDAQPFETTCTVDGVMIECQLTLTKPRSAAVAPRIVISDGLVAALQSLAAKRLVPESDASRLSGAGAGLTDND